MTLKFILTPLEQPDTYGVDIKRGLRRFVTEEYWRWFCEYHATESEHRTLSTTCSIDESVISGPLEDIKLRLKLSVTATAVDQKIAWGFSCEESAIELVDTTTTRDG